MTGKLFLRTSVIILAVGMGLGIYMGITEDFTFAPAHAHLNLAGGVLMFLAGLFYNSRPELSPRLATGHYIVSLLGAILLPAGIAGSVVKAGWAVPVVGAGSVLTFVAMLVFIFAVFKGTGNGAGGFRAS